MNKRSNRNKKYRVKSKFRFIAFLVIIMGIAVGAFGYATGSDVAIALDKPAVPITIEVTAGDTIWDIADHYKSDDKDIRRAVYEICEANDIQDGCIQSGMLLTIPANL